MSVHTHTHIVQSSTHTFSPIHKDTEIYTEIYTDTHTHTHTLSLSLTHTHTDTQTS